MEKKECKERERIETVLKILKKQVPLTVKQEKYCNDTCVERFLKAKGDNAKKAAKQLKATLCWRESVGAGSFSFPTTPSYHFEIFFVCFLNSSQNEALARFLKLLYRAVACMLLEPFAATLATFDASASGRAPALPFEITDTSFLLDSDHLIADEFSEELAGGFAYVAGYDDEARPVVVFRIKQEYPKTHSQKLFVRLLVFTMEVAISSMSRFVEQFVILFDASFFRSASAFLNFLMGTLKIIYDYYPCRLHKAFVIDPPSLFSYLWKGVRPFVELATVTAVVSSLDFEDSLEDAVFGSYPTRTASLRFDPAASAGVGVSRSSRFSFTVSHLDSLKPWYLSTSTATPRAAPNASPSIIGASPLNARSFSFASPAARSTPRFAWAPAPRSIPSTPCKFPPPKQRKPPPQPQPQPQQQQPRTPRPSFLQSPVALFSFRKEAQATQSRGERERESFLPYLGFHRRPYDEMVYRAKMRPPLGGLISIISPHLKQQQQQQMRRNAVNIHHHQKTQTLNY